MKTGHTNVNVNVDYITPAAFINYESVLDDFCASNATEIVICVNVYETTTKKLNENKNKNKLNENRKLTNKHNIKKNPRSGTQSTLMFDKAAISQGIVGQFKQIDSTTS